MFNKYDKWINQNKERLIDAWEVGFLDETPITADTYEDFVLSEWKTELNKSARFSLYAHEDQLCQDQK